MDPRLKIAQTEMAQISKIFVPSLA